MFDYFIAGILLCILFSLCVFLFSEVCHNSKKPPTIALSCVAIVIWCLSMIIFAIFFGDGLLLFGEIICLYALFIFIGRLNFVEALMAVFSFILQLMVVLPILFYIFQGVIGWMA
ncbi:hypothetical protein COB57_05935 [Candidatus Peregrinibacteria bacterium]|nr:MAG: hypothetical protein COB57_05935 [Candidatus Peregrinibacteria bacterium]